MWSITENFCNDNGINVANAIQNGTAIVVSSGSSKESFGTAALIIEGNNETKHFIAVNVTLGHPEDQSSLRSELSGLFGILNGSQAICFVHNIQSGTITVRCDVLIALQKCFCDDSDQTVSMTQVDYDMVSAIRAMLANSPLTWKWRHVKGPQDDDPFAVLDKWATRNVEMDMIAKSYWHAMSPLGPFKNIRLGHALWPLFINGQKISSNADQAIYEHIHCEDMFQWWVRKGRMPLTDVCRQVNWKATSEAMKELKITPWHWIAKHISGHCGVNSKLMEWGHS